MILQCPSCNARFNVPDGAIPPEGRTVKCGKCAHNWFTPHPNAQSAEPAPTAPAPQPSPAAPPTDTAPSVPDAETTALMEQALREATAAKAPPIAEVIEPTEAPKSKPAPTTPATPPPLDIPVRPFMYATPALAAAWLILALLAHYPTWLDAPIVGSLYKMYGVHTTEGIVFEEVTMQPQKNNGRTKYILSGTIANHSSVDRIIPSVRVILNDKDGKKIWEHGYPVNESLKAGEVYPFRIDNVETSYGDKVAAIMLDVGHKLQLMMR